MAKQHNNSYVQTFLYLIGRFLLYKQLIIHIIQKNKYQRKVDTY